MCACVGVGMYVRACAGGGVRVGVCECVCVCVWQGIVWVLVRCMQALPLPDTHIHTCKARMHLTVYAYLDFLCRGIRGTRALFSRAFLAR